ncbi:hypothetical protein ABT369_47475 [Dactylosporangium sp. NPDC000244]
MTTSTSVTTSMVVSSTMVMSTMTMGTVVTLTEWPRMPTGAGSPSRSA